MKTKMTLENRPCSRGNTSSTGGFSIVMLVFRGVPSRGTITYPLQELLRRMIFLTSRLVGDVFSFPRGYFHEFPAGKGEGGSVFRIRPPKRHSLLHLPKVPLLYVVLPFKNRQSAQKKQKKNSKKNSPLNTLKTSTPKKNITSHPKKKLTKHPIQHSTLNTQHSTIFPSSQVKQAQLNNSTTTTDDFARSPRYIWSLPYPGDSPRRECDASLETSRWNASSGVSTHR